MNSSYGFSFDVLFSLNENKKFNYIKEIMKRMSSVIVL